MARRVEERVGALRQFRVTAGDIGVYEDRYSRLGHRAASMTALVEIYGWRILLPFPMIPFKARSDGKIALTLDNNAWHFFFKEEIDLAKELPSDRFAITMPREVDIEWQAAPNGGDNDRRKRYIEAALASGTVEVRWLFGFSGMNPASGPPRVAGFGQGVWLGKEDGDFVRSFQAHFARAAMRPTGLKKNEADAWVGSRSFSSIVLTCESPDKRGPLKVAKRLGGKILYLQHMRESGLGLGEYVENYFKTF